MYCGIFICYIIITYDITMNDLNLINSLYKEMRAKIIETAVFYFFIDTTRLQIDTYSKCIGSNRRNGNSKVIHCCSCSEDLPICFQGRCNDIVTYPVQQTTVQVLVQYLSTGCLIWAQQLVLQSQVEVSSQFILLSPH